MSSPEGRNTENEVQPIEDGPLTPSIGKAEALEEVVRLLKSFFPSSAGGGLLFEFPVPQSLHTGERFRYVGLGQICRENEGTLTTVTRIFFSKGRRADELCKFALTVAIEKDAPAMIWETTELPQRNVYRPEEGARFADAVAQVEELLQKLDKLPKSLLHVDDPLRANSFKGFSGR